MTTDLSDDDIRRAEAAGMSADGLRSAVAMAWRYESEWPRSMRTGDGEFIFTHLLGETAPDNEVLGPVTPRGGPNGHIYRHGRRVLSWGDTARPDMTFSVAKSYLGLLAGIAHGDGLIRDLDEPVAASRLDDGFESAHNRSVTWRHLLQQTSEWEGTLFGKPDSVDHNRTLAAEQGRGAAKKGSVRRLQAPGSHWEYNDVRVNRLALSLLRVFRRPLPEVLKERVMDPIGASDTWRWDGYSNSQVDVDGRLMTSVPGGSHWGGGLTISSDDHARVGLLVQQDGVWHERRLLPAGWVATMTSPSALNPSYGCMWWLNTGRRLFDAAPEDSFCAHGAGMHCLWISPSQGLVVVVRWIQKPRLPELIAHIAAAAQPDGGDDGAREPTLNTKANRRNDAQA